MFKKLWVNIFFRVALIFAFTCIIVLTASNLFLTDFYIYNQKRILREQTLYLASVYISDTKALSYTADEINGKYNFDIEIYKENGDIVYTTQGGKMMDYININNGSFVMSRFPLENIESETFQDSTVLSLAKDPLSEKEFLLCTKELDNGMFAELRLQVMLLKNSAATAVTFVNILLGICTVGSVFWVFLFAKKFSSPISDITEVTAALADNNFDKRVTVGGSGEIRTLGESVNTMADSLYKTLSDLEKANEHLKEDIELKKNTDKMRKEFVANVSHELKTPISIISGYAEGIKLMESPEIKEKYCDIIIDESKRMNDLVLKILKLSKYEAGKITPTADNFDIYNTVSLIAYRIFKDDNSFVNKITPGTLCFSDLSLTEQVLKSYLENASSHKAKDGKVIVRAEEEGEKLKVFVYNDGEKIKDPDKELIWQSFYRGDSSHKRDDTRFGLGLSIVKAIITSQNEECGVYNTENGVEFWFTVKKGKV